MAHWSLAEIQGILKIDPQGFGVKDIEDLMPAVLQLKKSYWQHTKEFKLLWKWLLLKHSTLLALIKVRHRDTHLPKSQTTEEYQNNQQVYQATKTEVA